jgi:hypothetical protein
MRIHLPILHQSTDRHRWLAKNHRIGTPTPFGLSGREDGDWHTNGLAA